MLRKSFNEVIEENVRVLNDKKFLGDQKVKAIKYFRKSWTKEASKNMGGWHVEREMAKN